MVIKVSKEQNNGKLTLKELQKKIEETKAKDGPNHSLFYSVYLYKQVIKSQCKNALRVFKAKIDLTNKLVVKATTDIYEKPKLSSQSTIENVDNSSLDKIPKLPISELEFEEVSATLTDVNDAARTILYKMELEKKVAKMKKSKKKAMAIMKQSKINI